MLRVVLADDQDLFRAGFATILGAEPDIEVVAEAPTAPPPCGPPSITFPTSS